MDQNQTNQFELIENETLYQGFFRLQRYHLKYKQYDGQWSGVFKREIFERGNAAAVLLLDPKRETLVMVEQFRPGAVPHTSSPWLLELVAGMIEPDEQPEQVVRRESLEESGCQIQRAMPIHEYYVSPGGTTEKVWLFLGEIDAVNLPQFAGLDDEHEDIKVHQIAVEQAFAMLESGQINNGMTLIALQWLKIHWHNREAFWQ